MPETTVILICLCSSRGILPERVKLAVLDGLRAKRTNFTAVEDLCGLAAARNPSLAALTQSAGKAMLLACHSRAVRWLLNAAGSPIRGDRLQLLDLRNATADAILRQIPDDPPATAAPCVADNRPSDGWPPWFPVIDYDRCKQCKQCLSFCLFGVYGLSSDGKVVVANPRNCKNNCPACARICPEVAIMFPKLDEAERPLNGAEIGDEDELKAKARINVREMLGDDVYAALAERRKQAGKRRLLERSIEQAEKERAACSAEQQTGGSGTEGATTPPSPLGI